MCWVCQYMTDARSHTWQSLWLPRCCPFLLGLSLVLWTLNYSCCSWVLMGFVWEKFYIFVGLWKRSRFKSEWSIDHISIDFLTYLEILKPVLGWVWVGDSLPLLYCSFLTLLTICFSVLNISWVFGNKKYFLSLTHKADRAESLSG